MNAGAEEVLVSEALRMEVQRNVIGPVMMLMCPDGKSTSVATAQVITLVKSARSYAQMFCWGKLFIQNYLRFISVFVFDISTSADSPKSFVL